MDKICEKCPYKGETAVCSSCRIGNAPEVDAEPVRHGQLIITDQWECDDMGYVVEGQCSACNLYFTQYTSIGGFSYKYCPRCGARLDGDIA